MAKGYNTSGDILTRTRDGQDLNKIWADYQAALEQFNNTRQPLIDLLSFTTTTIIEDLVQPGTERFERASEFGLPKSIRPKPVPTARAYPFEWWDTRNGYTFQFLAGGPQNTSGASAAQLDSVMSMVMEADNALQFDMVMKALFNSLNRTTLIDGASYTVTALYNADGSYIPPYKGTTFTPGSHTHYTATGSSQAWIFDPNDFLTAARLVEEHGYTRANGYNVVFLMNPTDANATIVQYVRNTAFSTSTVVSLYDFIPSAGQNLVMQLPPGFTLAGGIPANTFAGLDVVGTWGQYMVIVDAQIPAGYFAAVAVRGGAQKTNVIGLREHENPAMRGLVLRPGNTNNYPLIDSVFIRGLGSAVGPRGAAAIMQNAAAYSVPATMAW
jgi:hypothetical protein